MQSEHDQARKLGEEKKVEDGTPKETDELAAQLEKDQQNEKGKL